MLSPDAKLFAENRLRQVAGVLFAIVLLIAGCARPSATPKTAEKPPEAAAAQPVTPAETVPNPPAQPAVKKPAPSTPATWPPTNVVGLAWSPDSAHMAVLTEAADLQIWDIQARTNWTWPVAIPQDSKLVGWRYDGLAIYLQTPENVLLEVDAKGNSVALTEPAGDGNYRYSPSPMSGAVARVWTGRIGGKFQLIGARGAVTAWEGNFLNWSSDGRYLAYKGESGTKIVSVESGKESSLALVGTPLWQPSGNLFLLQAPAVLYIIDVEGKTRATLQGARRATWSADGRRILFADSEGLWTVNADGANKQLLTRADLGAVQTQLVWLAQDEVLYMTVGTAGGGGTAFYPHLIKNGQITNLGGGSNGTRPELYVSPDRRHVAYIVGPPSADVPGDLVIYPAP